MTGLRIALLFAGVAGAVSRPWRLPAWVPPMVAAVVVLLIGGISPSGARHALRPLYDPIGFLLFAVPLAVMLDQLGFFSGLAVVVTRKSRGYGGLWILAAVVTTTLNLDASVVLLTPLYVRIAHQWDVDPLALAFQPVLAACLASSALPVSNLTNLIAAASTGAGTVDFLRHLALPSLAATVVGWWLYKSFVDGSDRRMQVGEGGVELSAAQRRALAVGGAVVALALVGFVGGEPLGIQPWQVAAAGDVVLLLITRRLPWRQVPVGTALVAASLGVLAAAAVADLHVSGVLGGGSTAGLARSAAVTAVGANLVNNLPALLVTLPRLGSHPSGTLWAVLVGVNMGPVLLVTGSLASLLWLDTLGRLGVEASGRDFTRVGLRVGLPSAAAGLGVLLLLNLLL